MPLFVLIYCFNILWLPAITLLGDGPLSHSRRFYLRRAWEAFSTGPVWWQAGPFPVPLLHVCACPPTAHFHLGTDSPATAHGALHTAHHEWFCSWPFVLLNHRPWWVSKPGCMQPWAALQLPQPEQGLERRATCRQRSAPWQLCSAGPPCFGGSQRVLQGAWAQPTAPGQC